MVLEGVVETVPGEISRPECTFTIGDTGNIAMVDEAAQKFLQSTDPEIRLGVQSLLEIVNESKKNVNDVDDPAPIELPVNVLETLFSSGNPDVVDAQKTLLGAMNSEVINRTNGLKVAMGTIEKVQAMGRMDRLPSVLVETFDRNVVTIDHQVSVLAWLSPHLTPQLQDPQWQPGKEIMKKTIIEVLGKLGGIQQAIGESDFPKVQAVVSNLGANVAKVA